MRKILFKFHLNWCAVPMANIVKVDDEEDVELEFDYKPPNESSADTTTPEATKSDDGGDDDNDDDDEISSNNSGPMMEPKLQQLFSSAHESGKEQIEVHLQTKPTEAHLHSLHALPALSRSVAARHPSLIRDIEKARITNNTKYLGNGYMSAIGEAEDEEHRQTMESTMIAEVLVYCDEVFCVRDLKTGSVVQGNEDSKVRQVVHGVRMERVRTLKEGGDEVLRNWMLTDIDDLLDGNRWFKPEGVPWFGSG